MMQPSRLLLRRLLLCRVEDWPVMPVEQTGFWLKPVGFYDANPSLDIPPGVQLGPAVSTRTGACCQL